MDKPKISDSKNGKGVLVEVLRVGACGTDREINDGEYGVAPEGFDFLVLGHENFGRVVEIGENVKDLKKGDFVVATVRRPFGHSIYDTIGQQDFTTDSEYCGTRNFAHSRILGGILRRRCRVFHQNSRKNFGSCRFARTAFDHRKRFETSRRHSRTTRHLATENRCRFGNGKRRTFDRFGFASARV